MGWINPFLQIILVQFILFLRSSQCKIPIRGKELNKFCLPNSSNDLCLFFCIYPSSKPVAQFLLKAQITLEKTVGVVGGRNRNTEGLSNGLNESSQLLLAVAAAIPAIKLALWGTLLRNLALGELLSFQLSYNLLNLASFHALVIVMFHNLFDFSLIPCPTYICQKPGCGLIMQIGGVGVNAQNYR